MSTDNRALDEGGIAVLAHVVLQHLSVVSAALSLLGDDEPGRSRPPVDRLLEQASRHTGEAVELLRDLIRGVPLEAVSAELHPPGAPPPDGA